MKKIFILISICLLVLSSTNILASTTKNDKTKQKQLALSKLNTIPDSAFQLIQPGKILENNLYLHLAKEGWKTREILTIVDDYVKQNKKSVKHTEPWIRYAKEWKPYWYMQAYNDTIRYLADPVYQTKVQKAFKLAFKTAVDESYPRLFYTPDDRMNGIRNTGWFRHAINKPGVARTHWIVANPRDSDAFMVELDGDGIWRTANNGKNWDAVTDRIPDRFHRASTNGFCIPVDPDDWNHFFALMNGTNPPVYETTDGGQTWKAIPNSTVKYLKRGYGFKDANGTFKIIGAERNDANQGTVWVTEDKGVTWRALVVPSTIKEAKWFQEFAFDPVDRNTIYICTQFGIIRNTDGMSYSGGRFNIEKMKFKVYNKDKTVLRSDTTEFPFPVSTGPLFLNIDPKNPSKMWAALGGTSNNTVYSAVYYSEDKGQTWVTLQDTYGYSYITKTNTPIGNGIVFGNEPPGSWLGGFGVNYKDPNYMYGCTMNSAKSQDNGNTFNLWSWVNQNSSIQADGKFYLVSSSRHNADNHSITPTPSGRVLRGSDSGILEIDPNINNRQWVNVGGDIGSLLTYWASANEFGDQIFVANTQDNDVQTYSYGRWGTWTGYEGSTVTLNPISNESYYPYGGDGVISGSSFSSSWIAGYGKTDVVTGNWYLWREQKTAIGTAAEGYSEFGVVKDIGKSVHPIFTGSPDVIRDFALCRDTTVGSSVFVLRSDGKLIRYDNENTSSYTQISNSVSSAKCVTVNPENANEIYLADNTAGILQTLNGGKTWSKISADIPTGIVWSKLFYHEGSGDIYAVSYNYGIFLKEAGSTSWRFWMKGYNPASFNNAQICYTSQEMMISDYGRGVWVADLEHPSDRFFKQGFKIKELSNINGVRTFGIDTKWNYIPQYHNYQWYVNGIARQGEQYRTFTDNNLNVNDKVTLKLILREAPDVQTTSSELTIADEVVTPVKFSPGRALKLGQTGKMDLGYQDFFDGDFTVEFWVNPAIPTNQAVLLANRKLESRTQKGWVLSLNNSVLTFTYSPYRPFNPPSYESYKTVSATITAGTITGNQWSHIALSMKKGGSVNIYVNGQLRASVERILKEEGLNSPIPLSLLGDGYDGNPCNATVDELKIWKRALSIEEIRQQIIAQPTIGDKDLVYYNDFNATTTEAQRETFTKSKIRPRTRALPSYPINTMALCATQAKYDTIKGTLSVFSNNSGNLVGIKLNKTGSFPATVNRFDDVYTASTIPGMSSDKFDVAPYTYKIDTYGIPSVVDSVEVHFYLPNASNYNGESIYMGSSYSDLAVWAEESKAVYNATDGTIVGKFAISDLKDQLITFVKASPAIVLSIPTANNQMIVPIYSKSQTSIPFNASLVKSMPAPLGDYSLTTTRPFANAGSINFGGNTSTSGILTINTDSIGKMGDYTPLTIKGMDDRMNSYKFTIQNCIAPSSQGNSLQLIDGGASAPGSTAYASLNGTNKISMMGWFRFDSVSMVSDTRRGLIGIDGSKYAMQIRLGCIEVLWGGSVLVTSPKITTSDLKRWIHIATVTRIDSTFLYVNGCKYATKNYTLLANTSLSSLSPTIYLGKVAESENWYDGAMDQISIWSRSLSESDVLKFMHQSPPLNDPGLVFSVNMDWLDSSGNIMEMKANNLLSITGTAVDKLENSSFPYDYSDQKTATTNLSSPTDLAAVQMPGTLVGKYYLTQYEHFPYSYVISGYSPVYKGFFTVDYIKPQNFSATDSITFVCHKPEIQAGDSMQLATRLTSFERNLFIKGRCKASANGVATCKIPASAIPSSFEAIWLTNNSNLQTVKLSVDGVTNLNNVVLKDNQVSIPIVIERTSTHLGGIIDLSVVQSNYAYFDKTSVDLSSTDKVIIPLYIDKNKINPLTMNDIQIGFIGASGDVLNFKFTLEPRLQLTLINGDQTNIVTANNPTTMLNVQAKFLQGNSAVPIVVGVNTDLRKAVSIGTGYLTITGGDAQKAVDYTTSASSYNAGWNLVSNPFLVSVLLNKEENRKLTNLTNFYYQYNPDSKCFLAYDARYFDNNVWIRPLEPIFVQAKSDNASLTVNSVARKQSTDGGIPSQIQELGLELWSSGKLFDRTSVRLDNGSNNEYVQDEDAPKMLSFDNSTAQIYTLTSGSEKLSINALPASTIDIPLGIKCGRYGSYTLKLVKATQGASITAQLIDGSTSPATIKDMTTAGDLLTFSLPSTTGTNETRFKIRLNLVNGIDKVNYPNLRIWTDKSLCRVGGMPQGTIITVFDTAGKRIVEEKSTTDIWTKMLPTGVYMVNLNIGKDEYKQKVIIP